MAVGATGRGLEHQRVGNRRCIFNAGDGVTRFNRIRIPGSSQNDADTRLSAKAGMTGSKRAAGRRRE